MSNLPPLPCNFVLAGAAHVDRTGWLVAPSITGSSNPVRFEESPGGAAFNVAGTLAILGHKPVLFSRLGNDNAAMVVTSAAKDRGIILHSETDADSNTGTYTSIIEPDGSLLIGLADMTVYDHYRSWQCVEYCHCSGPEDWLVTDANLPQTEISSLLNAINCRKAALTISKAKAARLQSILSQLDILFTNHGEACALLGVAMTTPGEKLCCLLGQTGLRSAVISNGVNDIAVMYGDSFATLPVPASDAVVDVTGAGDALAAGTLHRLAHGDDMIKAVHFGIKTARQIVEVKGAWRHDLTEQIDGASHEVQNK